MVEAALRYLEILRLIPRAPRSVTAPAIHAALGGQGIHLTRRQIERDLERLEGHFPLSSDRSAKPYRWSWVGEAPALAALDPQTALALELARSLVKEALPASTRTHLEPHFRAAREALARSPHLARWPQKIRFLPRGLALLPPQIGPGIQDTVYEALLAERKLKIRYRTRGDTRHRDADVSPLAVVFRDNVPYLVCRFDGQEDVHQIPLHRLQHAEALDAAADQPPRFELGRYIRGGAFGYAGSARRISLRALFEAAPVNHLYETRVSNHQTLEPQADGRVLLVAAVPDTAELRWWLLSYGSQVKVLGPRHLRDEFRASARELAALYR